MLSSAELVGLRSQQAILHRMMTAYPRLDSATLAILSPLIEVELRRMVRTHIYTRRKATGPGSAALLQVFVRLFGKGRSLQERLQFFVHAAPVVRRMALEYAAANSALETTRFDFQELDQWLKRLETLDSTCARMIELHYFAGLSTRETAAALNVSPQTVVRDLRFAKAWLQARMRWVGRA